MKIKNLVIYDALLTSGLSELDRKIFDLNFGQRLPYDVISFPDILTILSEKEPSPLKIFLIEQIQRMLILHPQINSLIFVDSDKGQYWEKFLKTVVCAPVFNSLKILFPKRDLNLNVIILQTSPTKCTHSKMTLKIMCSDSRLRRIYLDLQAHPGDIFFNDICICLPGSTLAIRKSLHVKLVIKYILEFCNANGIHTINFDHHGPDCGAYMYMKCLDSSYPPFSRKDQNEHLGKAASRFEQFRMNVLPGLELKINRLYTELDFANDCVEFINVSHPKKIDRYYNLLGQFK